MITSMFIVGASDDNRIKLPNVHVGLHFAEFAAEYGPLMNCNVLAGYGVPRMRIVRLLG